MARVERRHREAVIEFHMRRVAGWLPDLMLLRWAKGDPLGGDVPDGSVFGEQLRRFNREAEMSAEAEERGAARETAKADALLAMLLDATNDDIESFYMTRERAEDSHPRAMALLKEHLKP